MTIQAIETRYAGCRFRSRLEARFAVFFDALQVPWLYEPEGYRLDSGVAYLPDFLLYPGTDWAMWLEIKAQAPAGNEIAKCVGLADGTGIRTYLYFDTSFKAAPDLFYITHDDFFDRLEWVLDADGQWGLRPQRPCWMRTLPDTAVSFHAMRDGSRATRPGPWWWTDCPHCGRILLKAHGQIGWCPDLTEEEIKTLGELYPSFAHRTPRLLKAYVAARSARFEHGEMALR